MRTNYVSNRLNRILKSTSRRVGMTLVEILIVLTIMAGIMAFAAYNLFGVTKGTDIREAQVQVGMLSQMVEAYYALYNQLPDDLEDLATDNGMGRMLQGDLPDDPWGNPYVYRKTNDNTFEIISAGPDGSAGNDDDVTRGGGNNDD